MKVKLQYTETLSGVLLALGLALTIWCGNTTSAVAKEARRQIQTNVQPMGDDLFPWPWGTECPFPWEEIKGLYRVKAMASGPYNGHYMEFNVKRDDSHDGLAFLEISQFDRNGKIYAHGAGYSQKDERIVRGVLKEDATGREYAVMVRTYRKNENASCSTGGLVTAITFCTLRSKKCMTDLNYVLVSDED